VRAASLGWSVVGVDNIERAVFLGPQRDTRWDELRMREQLGKQVTRHELDIREFEKMIPGGEAVVERTDPPGMDVAAWWTKDGGLIPFQNEVV